MTTSRRPHCFTRLWAIESSGEQEADLFGTKEKCGRWFGRKSASSRRPEYISEAWRDNACQRHNRSHRPEQRRRLKPSWVGQNVSEAEPKHWGGTSPRIKDQKILGVYIWFVSLRHCRPYPLLISQVVGVENGGYLLVTLWKARGKPEENPWENWWNHWKITGKWTFTLCLRQT